MNVSHTNSTSLDFSVFSILVISIHVVHFFLGLPLNIYIIILFFPSHGVMDASNVFSWNQAISEMFFVLLGPFNSLCNVNLNLCIFEPLGFFLSTSLSSRSLFQCCVCLERYLAVVHPVTFLRYKPLRYRVTCSITAWVFSLVIAITCSSMFHNFPSEVFTVLFLLILTVDFFCCVSILIKLRHPGLRDRQSDVGKMNAAKKKAFQIVSFNLLSFVFQNIPLSVVFGIQNSVSKHVLAMVVVTCQAVNTIIGVLQPVYVLHRAGKLPLIQSTPFSTCCTSSGQG